MYDILILWLIICAIISCLWLQSGFSAVCSKWLC